MKATLRTQVLSCVAWAVAGVAAVALAIGCARHSGSRGRAQVASCRVEVVYGDPGYLYTEVGQVSFEAHTAGKRLRQYTSPYALVNDMRPDICAIGGEAVRAEQDAAGVVVRATVYRRIEPYELPVPPKPPIEPVIEGCDPACGPGFSCEGGSCIQMCDPACGEGQTCGDDAVCHPTA